MRIVVIILVLVVLLFVGKFVFKKINPVMKFEKIIKDVEKEYGTAIAQNVEKIYRLETANFTSGQFLATHSPGMMAFGTSFPYGWNTINNVVWSKNPDYKPSGISYHKENPGLSGAGGGEKAFIKFPNLKAAVFTLAGFLNHYGNNAGRWYSTNNMEQALYNAKLATIKTIFV